jgi:hypothetical protein
VLRPGLDQPPGRGDCDLDDISCEGVPGIGGRASPTEGPERPLVCPNLPRGSEPSLRLRLGGCLAADDRLRRWPDEAAKEFGEARANDL